MKYSTNEPTTLASLLSEGSDHQIQDRSSSKAALPLSPTASVSESNIVISELETVTTAGNNNINNPNNTLLQSLKFHVTHDLEEAEVQSPDNSIWDSLFADPCADFMLISSPRRDFMISSPKRGVDYMISSPRRDYMISSPRRSSSDYMISSPKREYMISSPRRDQYQYTVTPIYNNHNNNYEYSTNATSYNNTKGKTQSPLALPAMDTFLDEYRVGGYGTTDEVFDMGTAVPLPTEAAVGGMTATLLECLSSPSLTMKYGDAMGAGMGDIGHHGHAYAMMSQQLQHQHQQEVEAEVGVGLIAKQEMVDGTSYHGLGHLGCDNTTHEQDQDSGLQLVHLLLACAESVSKDDYLTARRYLLHLSRIVSPLGDSMQRVASCFVDALSSRLSPPIPSSPKSPSLNSTLKIYQILYQACPYIKFAHFTANQAIFEAFESEDRVHVIDLDILQGYQWPAFLQALAARPGGPPSLRITGVGYPGEAVRETGRHLAELAHSLRVPFEFHPAIADRLQDLRPHMLHRRVGEALAVNSVNRLHRVPGPHLGNLLSMIRDQAPNIVTLVEQEASHNGPHFLGRFLEALHYYSAIFDSLDATFPADSAARAKVEQFIFAAEIQNIVACEGPDRVERHERLEKWRKVMEGKGFKGIPLSQNVVTQSKILLGLYVCDGYRLTEEKGCLLLGWQDRAIIAASAWRC